jgi:hypothetical protein
MQRKHVVRPAVGTLLILLIPLTLQLTIGTGVDGQGFNWKLNDFVVIGALLFITGLLIEYVLTKFPAQKHRLVAVGLIILGFLWLYAELAVGIFTNWGS